MEDVVDMIKVGLVLFWLLTIRGNWGETLAAWGGVGARMQKDDPPNRTL